MILWKSSKNHPIIIPNLTKYATHPEFLRNLLQKNLQAAVPWAQLGQGAAQDATVPQETAKPGRSWNHPAIVEDQLI